MARLAGLANLSTLVFGALAVAAFWAAIRLCSRWRGLPWYAVAARVLGTLVLLAFGVLMVFYAAFGAGVTTPVLR